MAMRGSNVSLILIFLIMFIYATRSCQAFTYTMENKAPCPSDRFSQKHRNCKYGTYKLPNCDTDICFRGPEEICSDDQRILCLRGLKCVNNKCQNCDGDKCFMTFHKRLIHHFLEYGK